MNRKRAVFLGRQALPGGSEELSGNISAQHACSGDFSPSWFPSCENRKGPHSVTLWFISPTLAVPELLKMAVLHPRSRPREEKMLATRKDFLLCGCLVGGATAKLASFRARPAWSGAHRGTKYVRCQLPQGRPPVRSEEGVQGIPLPYQEVALSDRVQELVKIISLLFWWFLVFVSDLKRWWMSQSDSTAQGKNLILYTDEICFLSLCVKQHRH